MNTLNIGELDDLAVMGLFFNPSVALYHDFVQGRTKPYEAYLIAGPDAQGYCLGVFDLTVLVPFKAVVFEVLSPNQSYAAPYAFDCLSCYSYYNPVIQVAQAETRPVRALEEFCLRDLALSKVTSYEKDLNRLLSV